METDSIESRQYIKKMRSRDEALDDNWGKTCTPLALIAPEGKLRKTNFANNEWRWQFAPTLGLALGSQRQL